MSSALPSAPHKSGQRFLLGLISGTLTAIVVGLAGVLAIQAGNRETGVILFFLLPFSTGFVTAAVTHTPWRNVACCFMGPVVAIIFLLATGADGICVLAGGWPLILVLMFTGAVAGHLIFGQRLDRNGASKDQ